MLELEGSVAEKRLREATPYEAKRYLVHLVGRLPHGEEKRQVLATNLLKEGEAGPSVDEGDVTGVRTIIVNAIKSLEGWLHVPDAIWKQALTSFAKDRGFRLNVGWFEVQASRGRGLINKSAILPQLKTLPKLVMYRVEEYDPETGDLIRLGFEVGRQKT